MKFFEVKDDVVSINLDLKFLDKLEFSDKQIKNGYVENLKIKASRGELESIFTIIKLYKKELAKLSKNDY